jgi:hypothetical protein
MELVMKVKGFASRRSAEIKGGFASSFSSAARRPLTFITSSIGSPLTRLMLQANAGAISFILLRLPLAVSKTQNATFKDRNPQDQIERQTDGASAEVCRNSC